MMTIQNLLYRNVFWRGSFYLSGFILNIFIARHFEASYTGQLYYVVSWLSLITLILSASMESGMLYFASKKEIEQSVLLNFSLLWIAVIALLLSLSLVLIFFLGSVKLNLSTSIFAIVFVCGNLLMTTN